MLAKQASKALKNHFEGKTTKASIHILSDIAKLAESRGLKPPFSIEKVAVSNLDEPEIEKRPEFDSYQEQEKMVPEIEEFSQENSETRRFIPKEVTRHIFLELGPNAFGPDGEKKYEKNGGDVPLSYIDEIIKDLGLKIKEMEENEMHDFNVDEYKDIETLIEKLENIKNQPMHHDIFKKDIIRDIEDQFDREQGAF